MPESPSLRRVPYSSLIWNEGAGRYTHPQLGKFLSPASVRAVTDADIARRQDNILKLGERLANGDLNVEQFRDELHKQVKYLHTAQAVSAEGGFHAMTPAKWGKVGQRMPYQYERVDACAADLAAGRYAAEGGGLTPDFQQRLKWFAQAGRNTFCLFDKQKNIDSGRPYVENLLNDMAQHCSPQDGKPSCPEETAKGRVLAHLMTVSGDRACGPACQCRQNYYAEASPEPVARMFRKGYC